MVDPTAALEAFTSMSAGGKGIWLFGSIFLGGWVLKAVAEWRSWRKLSLEERQANREGFAAQVQLLSGQLRDALERLAVLNIRYDTLQNDHDAYRQLCRDETDQLRGHIIRLENNLAALHRRRSAASVAAAHALTPEGAPEAAASTARVALILGPAADPEGTA